MAKMVLLSEHGGPEVLKIEDHAPPAPGPGEVQIEHSAIGLNFIDVYHRTGLYPVDLPGSIGMEAAGTITAIGEGVDEFSLGDRVAYASPPLGAYAQIRVMPADRIVKIPDGIDDRTAAAIMLKGMTAWYLLRRVYEVGKKDTILFHAAAGGVGLIACQWAKALGATVIGTVGSAEKAELARQYGCDHTILYREEDFTERTRALTNGEGVPVVYDSIGRDTFIGSLDCLRPFGLMVSFGNASGPVEPFDIGILAQKGSLFLTRPTLMTYTARREDLLTAAKELFDRVLSGDIRVNIGQTYPLDQVADAHRDLEARKTTGSTLLIP